MNILNKKKKELDEALEQSRKNLKEAKEAVVVAELLQEAVPHNIERMFLATSMKEIWITLKGKFTLERAIELMESLNPLEMGQFRGSFLRIGPEIRKDENKNMEYKPYALPYTLKVRPPFNFGNDEYFLYGFIQIENYLVKVSIEVELPARRLTRFIHNGQTTRSKIIRTVRETGVDIPSPFDNYFVWGGGAISEMELFKFKE